MKTNQEMIRKMGDFNVVQRTKDGMFNATELIKQWNEKTGEKKEITKFFENSNTSKFIEALIIEENLNTQDSAYLKSRGKRGGTWMHPYLFVKFSMWLNPSFEVKVIKFVYDEMIKYRNDAGDAYRELAVSVAKIVHPDFMPKAMSTIGEALNWIVFNCHEKAIRNKFGDEKHQRELWMMERKVSELIDDGFIHKYEDLMNYLRKQYQKKNSPKIFNDKVQ